MEIANWKERRPSHLCLSPLPWDSALSAHNEQEPSESYSKFIPKMSQASSETLVLTPYTSITWQIPTGSHECDGLWELTLRVHTGSSLTCRRYREMHRKNWSHAWANSTDPSGSYEQAPAPWSSLRLQQKSMRVSKTLNDHPSFISLTNNYRVKTGQQHMPHIKSKSENTLN